MSRSRRKWRPVPPYTTGSFLCFCLGCIASSYLRQIADRLWKGGLVPLLRPLSSVTFSFHVGAFHLLPLRGLTTIIPSLQIFEVILEPFELRVTHFKASSIETAFVGSFWYAPLFLCDFPLLHNKTGGACLRSVAFRLLPLKGAVTLRDRTLKSPVLLQYMTLWTRSVLSSCLTGKTEIPGQSVQFVSKQTDERQLQTYGDMCCLCCLLQHSSNENLLLLLNSADSRLSWLSFCQLSDCAKKHGYERINPLNTRQLEIVRHRWKLLHSSYEYKLRTCHLRIRAEQTLPDP